MAINRQLARYLPAPVLLNLGLFIHVLLFNLYLADLGFREDVMGHQASLMTIGTIAGAIVGAALVRRWGLRFACVFAALGVALAMLLRPQASEAWLGAASIGVGFFIGCWHVTNPPAIAALSLGAAGFSMNIAFSIAIGAAGGVIGGRLPGWIGVFMPAAGAVELKRLALMFAALPAAAAALVAAPIAFPSPPPQDRRSLRASRPFLMRFLPAVAVWYVFSAGFIPFFNAYLKNRMGASTEAIGGVYALVHLPQAAAVLLMPLLIRRFGLVGSVVFTQIMAAFGMLSMWRVETIREAATVYMIFMSLQVMSEPGLQNLLMRGVPAEERAPVTAANLLLLFATNAAVTYSAGRLIAARGYGVLFIALGITGLAAAAIFAFGFRPASLSGIAPTPNGDHSFPGPPQSSSGAASDREAPG